MSWYGPQCRGPVVEAIAAAPVHNAVTFGANIHGKPYTVGGFRKVFQILCDPMLNEGKVGADLAYKGLRHTVTIIIILAETDFDDRTIMDMLEQRTTTIAYHHSKRSNRARKLTGVVKDFEAEVNRRRTKVVKPS